jgi:hypothetical protein
MPERGAQMPLMRSDTPQAIVLPAAAEAIAVIRFCLPPTFLRYFAPAASAAQQDAMSFAFAAPRLRRYFAAAAFLCHVSFSRLLIRRLGPC